MTANTNAVTTFDFRTTIQYPTGPELNTHSIRVVDIEGNPWFVVSDVCEALGLAINPANGSYTNHLYKLDKAEKTVAPVPTSLAGRSRSKSVISESGLYKLIMRSDKPQAKAFQDWVTKEVLPSIRKTGAFVTGQASLVENPRMDPLALMLCLVP